MSVDGHLRLELVNSTTKNEKILCIIGKQLAVKGHTEFMSEEGCLLNYIDYRNVSCIIKNSPHYIRNYMDSCQPTYLVILYFQEL